MTVYWIGAVTILLFSVPSSAETLTLRNSAAVTGKLQSIDAQEVSIERCGRLERYARGEVKSISLESVESEGRCAELSQPNIELPVGMSIALQILDYIDSQREPVGQVFRAKLESALEVDGRILVSHGSPFIVRMVRTGGTTSQPHLALDLVGVQIGKRWTRIEPLPVKGRSLGSASSTIATLSPPTTGGGRISLRPNTSLTFVLEQAVRLQPEGR